MKNSFWFDLVNVRLSQCDKISPEMVLGWNMAPLCRKPLGCNKKIGWERVGGVERLELGKSPTMRNNEKSKWDLLESYIIQFQNFYFKIRFL